MRVSMLHAGAVCGAVVTAILVPPVMADVPDVVASIKPVHSLVAGVMGDLGTPTLLIEGGGSPHTTALRPSQAALLQDSDVVFWIGWDMETFLGKPLQALAGGARVVALHEADGVLLLPYREGATWETRAHHDAHHHAHAHHDASDHHVTVAPPDDHGAETGDEPRNEPRNEPDGHEHAQGGYNMHIWLDPTNARAMVGQIVATLSDVDPANADRYRTNGASLDERLADLDARLKRELQPVADRPYIVFHDAYQYFENRYDLNPLGAITVSPDRKPGPQTLYDIRQKIVDGGAACVFAEPQFEPAVVQTVISETDARAGVLDPLGADLPSGPDTYFSLMRHLAASLTECLGPSSGSPPP